MYRLICVAVALAALFCSGGEARAWVANSAPASCALISAAAMVEGNWEIVLLDTQRRQFLNLTRSPEDEQSPAWSPDGRVLAFAARKAGNWDIYTRDMAAGTITRLTSAASFEGFPSFSPDGKRIVFEAMVEGDSDIYVMPATGGAAQAIVTDSSADVEPTWAGNDQLLYSTWRDEERHLALFDMQTQAATLLTEPHEEPIQAALSPDGRQVAYVSVGSGTTELRLRELAGGVLKRVPARLHNAWPFWGGDAAAPVLHAFELSGGGAYEYPAGWRLVTRPDTSVSASKDVAGVPMLPGEWQRPSCAPAGAARPGGDWQPLAKALVRQLAVASASRAASNPVRGAVEIGGIDAPSPLFASAVADSFNRLRLRVRDEAGFDYLSRFGDTWRTIGNMNGELMSWHKTGRAFDVLHAYNAGGQRRLYLARQVLGGQTYFRIYLLARRQDGSQGAPMRESVWEVLGRQDEPVVVREGGYPLPPPRGYFVDITDLAAREGWTRISGLTPPDGDWRKHYNDIEYWHYERRDGMAWYEAMRLLYSEERLREYINVEILRDRGFSEELIRRSGVTAN